MTDEVPSRFLADAGLPETFRLTVEAVCRPLADLADRARRSAGRTVVVGLCGAQGSGKSTIAAATARLLDARGRRAAVLSIDDVYLPRAERGRLATAVHPLLAVRGPPGTHDVGLACETLDSLASDRPTRLPAFDKATDEPVPPAAWRTFEGPADVVIFEGWCVGARPEPADRLVEPVNDLERDQDPRGTWRAHANDQLAGPYAPLFGRIGPLVLLAAPGFEVVRGWRTEQEHKLRGRVGGGMSDAEIGRFVQHYERLTRWILDEMPGRADWTIPLGPDRRPMA